jgi:hypothetical protein
MKICAHRIHGLLALLTGMALLIAPAAQAAPGAASRPPVLIQINDLDGLLRLADRLAAPASGSSGAAPSALLWGLFQGTDWLDPARAVVLGLRHDGQRSSWRALIPFRTPNESFRAAFGASAGSDYYILTLPPGAPPVPAPGLETALVEAAARPGRETLSLDLAAAELLSLWRPRLEEALRQPTPNAAAGATGLDPAAVGGFLDTLAQLERLRLRLDGAGDEVVLDLEAAAAAGSFMAGVLQPGEGMARLGGYTPDYPVHFHSRPYNMRGVMQLLDAAAGPVYRRLGLDLEAVTDMTRDFTGEMAGGMRPSPQGGVVFEAVYALHPSADADNFVEEVYLPGIEAYGRQLATALAAEQAALTGSALERTADSVVAGRPVAGYRSALSLGPLPGSASPGGPGGIQTSHVETRVTTLGDLLLTASDDTTLERLLRQAPAWTAAPAEGPTMRLVADLGAILQAWQSQAGADHQTSTEWRPGTLTLQMRLDGGRAVLRTTMATADLHDLMQLLTGLQAAEGPVGAALTAPIVRTAAGAPPATGAPAPVEGTADFWMDRGGLLSAYGNYKGAVACFQKALTLEPRLAEAAFQLGVAYGELGLFEQAVEALSRAVAQAPDRGHYHYGRGRVYLLAGDEDLAMQDFMEAAFLGDSDARTYLRENSGVSWE